MIDPDDNPVTAAEVSLDASSPRTVKASDDGMFVFDKLTDRACVLSATHEALSGGPYTYRPTHNGAPIVIRLGCAAAVIAPGTYDVVIESPDFGSILKHNVTIEPGKTTDLGTLAGVVVDAGVDGDHGHPVADGFKDPLEPGYLLVARDAPGPPELEIDGAGAVERREVDRVAVDRGQRDRRPLGRRSCAPAAHGPALAGIARVRGGRRCATRCGARRALRTSGRRRVRESVSWHLTHGATAARSRAKARESHNCSVLLWGCQHEFVVLSVRATIAQPEMERLRRACDEAAGKPAGS
ncbi:MAG TPA: hypothetical protein VH165_30785 [Kofleriaceae bacterium]|nr:hypothetical protein [Kofleriaceae bacterium]